MSAVIHTDYLIIGAGQAGLVLARLLDAGSVTILDPAVGGYKIGESIVPEQFQHPELNALLPAIVIVGGVLPIAPIRRAIGSTSWTVGVHVADGLGDGLDDERVFEHPSGSDRGVGLARSNCGEQGVPLGGDRARGEPAGGERDGEPGDDEAGRPAHGTSPGEARVGARLAVMLGRPGEPEEAMRAADRPSTRTGGVGRTPTGAPDVGNAGIRPCVA